MPSHRILMVISIGLLDGKVANDRRLYQRAWGDFLYQKVICSCCQYWLDTNRLEEDASFLEIKKCIYNIYNGVQFPKDFVRYESVANVHH